MQALFHWILFLLSFGFLHLSSKVVTYKVCIHNIRCRVANEIIQAYSLHSRKCYKLDNRRYLARCSREHRSYCSWISLISGAASSSLLLQVGKNSPSPIQIVEYSGLSLSYYINKL
ncbi:hypothetical protein H5410_012486 [Solanum commersonii]|uniref:Secreted protein n=1 Tax=Solanum commersonii TaxID=4109 RepID=A0A9J6ASB1_SOLCO|nr:hypothetical protein H5410_012486 [Solanum commersonii]